MDQTRWVCAALAIALGLVLSPPSIEARESELAHDDGTREDKRSTAGGGHAVLFDRPDPSFVATHVRVHGERYGGRYDPFYAVARVSLCDVDLKPICETVSPYTAWQPGKPGWADIPIGPCRVPERFYAVVEFFPTATKGVYMSIDAADSGRSHGAVPGGPASTLATGTWMIRVRGTTKAVKVERPRGVAVEIARGEGETTGRQSTAGSGHAVLFKAPAKQRLLTGLSIYGQRYGGRYNPNRTLFHVFVCDKKLKVLARSAHPYALFPAGSADWTEVPLPPIPVPRDFAVLVYFDPTATKGIYMGKWSEPKPASLQALPGTVHGKTAKGEGWMLRVRMAASGGKAELPTPDEAAGSVDALRLAEVLEALDEAERREDVAGANALIASIAKEAPEEARRMGRFHESDHFLLRESGVEPKAVPAIFRLMEAARDEVVERFGFARLSAVKDRKVHLRITIDEKLETVLFTNPRSPHFSQIVLRGPARALWAPSRGGPHVVYGFCHELGHVLIGWEDGRHQWSHYLGSVVTSAVHARLGDAGWYQPYDFDAIEGLPRFLKEIEGIEPGLTTDAGMARLFHEIGERFGPAVYGKAIPWVLANRKGKPFEAVRLYRVADLRAALLQVLGEEQAEALTALFGD